jgi:adenine-specific DNA-methyltransferase
MLKIVSHYSRDADVTLYAGDCLDFLDELPRRSARLIVTSPPFNIGKPYEKRLPLNNYLQRQELVITKCVDKLKPDGSICWQVGNYVDNNRIYPLDILLYPIFEKLNLRLRNRIIWHYEHGLHCSQRLSGRYQTIMWFTRGDEYVFNLDPIRAPQKYPGKRYFKGPKKGQYSSNPLGKNPGDVWIIPNVKFNHVEKTAHPCQFPVELVERLILSLSRKRDLIVDPYIGVGTTAVAAILNNRRAAGSDSIRAYLKTARERVRKAHRGELKIRPMYSPIYVPKEGSPLTRRDQ